MLLLPAFTSVQYIRYIYRCWYGDTVSNTTSSFLIDVIIRNQDIKKLETTCFGLTAGHLQVSS
jgi:hypothetical protein